MKIIKSISKKKISAYQAAVIDGAIFIPHPFRHSFFDNASKQDRMFQHNAI